MSNRFDKAPTEQGKSRYPEQYDEIILVDADGNEYVKPPTRPRGRVDPKTLADWKARTYPHIRAQRDAASRTTFDDALPSDLMDHIDETRSALRRLPTE